MFRLDVLTTLNNAFPGIDSETLVRCLFPPRRAQALLTEDRKIDSKRLLILRQSSPPTELARFAFAVSYPGIIPSKQSCISFNSTTHGRQTTCIVTRECLICHNRGLVVRSRVPVSGGESFRRPRAD